MFYRYCNVCFSACKFLQNLQYSFVLVRMRLFSNARCGLATAEQQFELLLSGHWSGQTYLVAAISSKVRVSFCASNSGCILFAFI